MKHLLNRWLLLFVMLLGLSALACNLPFGGEAEPTARPTTDDDDSDRPTDNDEETAPEETNTDEADNEVVETNEEVAEEAETAVTEDSEVEAIEGEFSEEDGGLFSGLFEESVTVRDTVQLFDTLDSYQMDFSFGTTVDDDTQQMQITILATTNPPASQMTFNFVGFAGPVDLTEIKMTQIAETTYTIVPELGCITTSEGDLIGESFGQTIDANQFLEDIGEAELVGEETINGVETLHYTFDETDIEDDEYQFNWAQGDVYIAKDGDYAVRLRLEGEGIANDLGLA